MPSARRMFNEASRGWLGDVDLGYGVWRRGLEFACFSYRWRLLYNKMGGGHVRLYMYEEGLTVGDVTDGDKPTGCIGVIILIVRSTMYEGVWHGIYGNSNSVTRRARQARRSRKCSRWKEHSAFVCSLVLTA
jgi:hypothetical protein